ncbi:MAG: bifunctional uridylyltransferase/uridylyl-removing protein, partial [Rhodospirillaceae bacterium]
MSTPKVRKPRELIDRKEVTVVLERIAEQVTDPRARRTELLSTMRTVLTDGQAEVQRRFLEGRGSGQAAFSENTYLMDQIIRLLFDFTIAHVYPPPDNDPKNDETRNMTLLAVGGYGRGEMSPQSDVDLMFLIPRKSGD